MNKDLTIWILVKLYPALYSKVPELFPEHHFQRTSFGWISNAGLGDTRERSKYKTTVILRNNQAYISEVGGRGMSLVKYVMRRDEVDLHDAIDALCKVACIDPPGVETSYDYHESKEVKRLIMERANEFMVSELQSGQYGGPMGDELSRIRGYLLDYRGYSMSDIELMGLGYLRKPDHLYAHLSSTFDVNLVDDVLGFRTNRLIGNADLETGEHWRLSIPYRSRNAFVGFVLKCMLGYPMYAGFGSRKYLITKDSIPAELPFNMTALNDEPRMVVVSDYMTALYTSMHGCGNVVAIERASLSRDHIGAALRNGLKRIVLCFNNSSDGEGQTKNAVDALKGIDAVDLYKPRYGSRGETPEDVIRNYGVASFNSMIDNAELIS